MLSGRPPVRTSGSAILVFSLILLWCRNIFFSRLTIVRLFGRNLPAFSSQPWSFLQGLLLMNAGARPAKFKRWWQLWEQWDRWLQDQALTSLNACLGFVLSQPEIDRVIVGVDGLEQLRGIIASAEAPPVMPPPGLISEDLDLINPSRWGAY